MTSVHRLLSSCRFLLPLLACLACLPGAAKAASEPTPEGLREHWDGHLYLNLREPVVSTTTVDNARKKINCESDEEKEAAAKLSAEDCGTHLFRVSGKPAPRLHWADQNRLNIDFAPGSSPSTLYTVEFVPGTTYLSGKPMAQRSFTFRAKPVKLNATLLPGYPGGAALLSAAHADTAEALALCERHEGLRVRFRRMRHIPLVGWSCLGTVDATLRPAKVGDGICSESVLNALLDKHKPGSITAATPLPRTLLVLPTEPLVPGARYEVEVLAAAGSGFEGGICGIGSTSEALSCTLQRQLEGEEKGKARTHLRLSFSHPVPEAQLRALWGQLAVSFNGSPASLGRDGRYLATVNGRSMALRQLKLIPAMPETSSWSRDKRYSFAPGGCASGFEMVVEGDQSAELRITVPAVLKGARGLAMRGPARLAASLSPACPAMTGNGSNLIPWKGDHRLRLPLVNVGRVSATAYRWEAEEAAQLLPLIRSCMRDDTHACELLRQLDWLKRRASEGLSTDLNEMDGRTASGAGLSLINREWKKMEPLRTRVLARATAYPSLELQLTQEKGGNRIVQRGEAILDMDKLTAGQLRPGLYLVSLTSHPNEEVVSALSSLNPDHAHQSCTVDYLVQVTDMSLQLGSRHLLARSLSSGKPLSGIDIRVYKLPPPSEGKAPAKAAALPMTGALTLKQGDVKLPDMPADCLLLLRRGDDYRLCSLSGAYLPASHDEDEDDAALPHAELYKDRPLYRPGDTAHVRGVLRAAARRGGPALPGTRKGSLTIRKPNGDVMETRELTLDAYGAFTADIALPTGEEDITGTYNCTFEAGESGETVEAELELPCEVFRRDAFELSVQTDISPVAPDSYRISVEARDYNGTPLADGKLRLEIRSNVGLLEAEGKPAPGVKKQQEHEILVQELTLNAEGRAEVRGRLAPFTTRAFLSVNGSVANGREEYVTIPSSTHRLNPANFIIELSAGDDDKPRLILKDAATDKPLARPQELQLRLLRRRDTQRHWPSGLMLEERSMQQEWCRRITVPADCADGLDLSEHFSQDYPFHETEIEISGCDTVGRKLIHKGSIPGYYTRSSRDSDEADGSLEAEGRQLIFRPRRSFTRDEQLQVYVCSQGRTRCQLVSVKAGAKEIRIPLNNREYGEVAICVVSCGQDKWACFTQWSAQRADCEVARPDKQLRVELNLPQEARPGQARAISGRVLNAEGQPVKASVNLFAVDAGMMSVAPYKLPELAAVFYKGKAPYFSLNTSDNPSPCAPRIHLLPNVWAEDTWMRGQASARFRSVWPAGLYIRQGEDSLGVICRGNMSSILSRVRDRSFWASGAEVCYQAEPAASPVVVPSCDEGDDDCADSPPWLMENDKSKKAITMGLLTGGMRSGSGVLMGDTLTELVGAPRPRLRTNFEPVALWQGAVDTAADGSFRCEMSLPDTLTTYRVYALVLGADGSSFGQTEGEFLVNQPLMLTAGTPFFMSQGDRLLLPLTITNNSDKADCWQVSLEGAGDVAPQRIELAAQQTATLYFEVRAQEEGERVLSWTATSESSGDAVEARFPVLYPAPLLKEHHRLVLEAGEELKTAGLIAPEPAAATRGSVTLEYATSPLLHLSGSLDYLLSYPYGCTEQSASALLPWLYYRQLAPYCPNMARSSEAEAAENIRRGIAALLARQQKDGGLSYWGSTPGEVHPSSPWVSAYAGLVLTIAQEQGCEVPEEAMKNLRRYLGRQDWKYAGHLIRYASARTRQETRKARRILLEALGEELEERESGCPWSTHRGQLADLRFMLELTRKPAERHAALLRWMRSQGRDYRHQSTWSSGWQLIALGEYLKLEPQGSPKASLSISGESREAGAAPARMEWKAAEGRSIAQAAPALSAQGGRVYVTLRVKAQPTQTDYPGVTEKGLQVTRIYETQDADGQWRESTNWKVGEVVRVTLTCAKVADELEYLVLEDKLPSCMEAINPRVPGQAAGLADGGAGEWSPCIDHKEYLADRVRAFSTRWAGRDLINMRYYARVKRAGEAIAPPAQAQLMYEPQTYGLSPNTRVTAEQVTKP